ncbi:MAG: penicillin-binding protein transpeptidase, partial [Pseudonocardia sp.]|nr:penicillin-binding protein transpeptidase [Pseudonocardia sp.]
TRAARPDLQARPARHTQPRRSTGVPAPRDANGAIGRAYPRRAVRERRQSGEATDATSGRSQFVLLIMVLFGVGLVASLWLSTTAAADSYRLDAARQATRDLSERSESLSTEIASMQSAPALAAAARQMGMVQVSDVARLVVRPDGSVQVVGAPKAAVAPAAPAPVLAPVDQQQGTGAQVPDQQQGTGPQGTEQQAADDQVAPEQPGVPAEQGPVQGTGTVQQAPVQQQAPTQQAPTRQPGYAPLAAPAAAAGPSAAVAGH